MNALSSLRAHQITRVILLNEDVVRCRTSNVEEAVLPTVGISSASDRISTSAELKHIIQENVEFGAL
jgi:hypothetical protein